MLDVGILGGGPGGLFLARLLRLRGLAENVHVHERNSADATFGFGVVFSDRTMSALREADPETYRRIVTASRTWTDMEVRYGKERLRYGGYGFTAIARRTLLRILQEQAVEAGARLDFEAPADAGVLSARHEMVVAADGAGSATRESRQDTFGTLWEHGAAKYIWFGTTAPFEMVTFPFEESPFGTFAAHAYPYADGLSTFIVETDESTWRAAGMDMSTERASSPGESDGYAQELMERIFSKHLDGHSLLANNSKWSNFRVIRNRSWWHGNIVLLGDAAHTAHFSVGSGTKLAMEDAIGLVDALGGHRPGSDLSAAFRRYEQARRPAVERTQRWALPSMRWWENFGRRMGRDPDRFGFHFLTRTPAIGLVGLRRRHADRIAAAELACALTAPEAVAPRGTTATGALALPVAFGDQVAANRLVTVVGGPLTGAAGQQIRACAGYVLAGSGLVLADWRPTPGRPDELGDATAWRRLTDEARLCGALVGAVMNAGDHRAAALATAAAMPVVEVLLGDRRTGDGAVLDPAARAHLRNAEGTAVLLAGLVCPTTDPHSPPADRLVEQGGAAVEAGAAALHLWAWTGADRLDEDVWERSLAYADRLRTETGAPVVLDVPDGWALEQPGGSGDDLRTRLHTAVVSGRADAVAGWPLPRYDRPSAGSARG